MQATAGGPSSFYLIREVRDLAAKYAEDTHEHRLLKSVVEALANDGRSKEDAHREVRRLEDALALQQSPDRHGAVRSEGARIIATPPTQKERTKCTPRHTNI